MTKYGFIFSSKIFYLVSKGFSHLAHLLDVVSEGLLGESEVFDCLVLEVFGEGLWVESGLPRLPS